MNRSRSNTTTRTVATLAVLTLTAAFATADRASNNKGNIASSKVAAVDPSLIKGLVWRNVGPFRGGRVSAVSGAIGQSGVMYAGMPNGGVWKTTNAGITWTPIFDDVKDASSIGAIEVAPSDPNVVYVGLGDGTTGGGHNEGNGLYKSTDAGKTWTHVGLDFAKQIPSILVDPKDPNVLLVAVLGDFFHPSENRGVFRSTDGGKTWTKTLYTDDQTGAQKLAWAFDNPDVILCATNRHCSPVGSAPQRRGQQTAAPTGVKGTALFKSTDRGLTWKEIKGEGLPGSLFGRTSVAIAQNTNSQRMFFVSNGGLWRTDDGGSHWQQMDREDGRVRNGQGGYNCGVFVNPKDPNTVIVFNTCSYISHDGGETFTGFKGAPGGDDPQQGWLDPTDPHRMIFGVDQGATVSLDGGQSWSLWYNQANGQFYHIAVSNNWPYWIYANMQDSGAIGMSSRGNYGEITPLDWSPNPGWEWGSICVDPLNPNIVYSTGPQNDVIKEFFPSGQWQSISPDNNGKLALRHDFNQPIQFSPTNPHELFLGYQYLMSSTDGGRSWHAISPDLSFPKGYVPPKPEKPKPAPATKPAAATKNEDPDEDEGDETRDDGDQFIEPKEAMERALELQIGGRSAAISSLSPSSMDGNVIWAGMSNGTIKLTRDHGKTWDDVNIPKSTGSIVSIDSSHTDKGSAYVAVTSGGVNNEPRLYRTKDWGKTWTKITTGLPTDEVTGSWANVIRADTKREGLLFVGTESSVYFSLDDGDHWQPLRLNLPNTSYRDMRIKDNDLVVGTYGRSFFILDDYSPLRQLTSSNETALLAPGDAVRARRNVNQDTPFPPEVPHSLNAPDGALVYYNLASPPSGEITLDVTDSAGKLVRHMSSAPIAPLNEPKPPIPDFWIAPLKPMPTEVGLNRVNWDLRYDAPPAFNHSYEINANPGLTPPWPEGPLVAPGVFTLTLTVDGKKYTQKVTVTNDPRSPGSARDVEALHAAQMALYEGDKSAMAGIKAVSTLRTKLNAVIDSKSPKEVNDAATALLEKLNSIGGPSGPRRGFGGGGGGFNAGPSGPSYGAIQGQCVRFLLTLENGDVRPNQPVSTAIDQVVKDLNTLNGNLKALRDKDLKALNELLKKNGLATID
jgi:photosystem II stability/assembly factor-like uncharacterized protein